MDPGDSTTGMPSKRVGTRSAVVHAEPERDDVDNELDAFVPARVEPVHGVAIPVDHPHFGEWVWVPESDEVLDAAFPKARAGA